MKICLGCGQRYQQENWRCPVCGWIPPQCLGFISFAPDIVAREVGFKSELFERLRTAEERHFWFRSRNSLLAWSLQTYFPNALSFLEIGCGSGTVLLRLRATFPGLKLVGGDALYEGLALGRRIPGVTLFQMDARCIPFENEFDVIGAFDLLEHIEEDETVLRQMYRATKSGGGILVTVPQHKWLWRPWDVLSGHRRRYFRNELVQRMEQAGFCIIRCTSFVSFLLPLILLVRLFEEKTRDPVKELKINPLLSAFLEKALTLERLLIRFGISFPAGASLLIIAFKKARQVS